jgi:predicted Zn-dependent peptidase
MPDVPATLENPLPNDPTSTTIHRLANGLTIYLNPNKEVPRIVAMIAVRAGSKNDPADATGQAHYLEHMLFKGTTSLGTIDYEQESPHIARISELYELRAKTKDVAERAKIDKQIDAENIACSSVTAPSEVAKFYRSIGANMNAWTSDEETVYHADIPSNRLRAWAALESDRMSHAIFRLFPGELETVYEEKNRTMDNPSHALEEEITRRIYKFHPYGTQPTIGTVEHLKNPSFKKMRAFYETWYVPNNMAIVLSGDFDRREALDIITQYFGSWTPKPLPSMPNWPLPPPNGEERYEIKFESEETVVIAWPFGFSGNQHA